ncbi:hypothetical protein K443DRAFT_82476 [Laccaria amethystina LaAM-08-1]|uniref:CHAT domain-containing protein n=1 Tax=Laccaria amethystina LaAM-08-1 TaxID=1095629 RepID=A0A0C9XBQ3_9AGAR|nr:hypothetical protein K443DRAFT_82476 [Laccaria amethystina LaAM-08-1]
MIAITYQTRFKRLGNVDDLTESLEFYKVALAAMPEGSDQTALVMQNLAGAHRDKFAVLGTSQDIKLALGYDLEAVKVLPAGHPDLPIMYHSLGLSYRLSFEWFGSLKDLELARDNGQTAVDGVSEGPSLANFQYQLAGTYKLLYQRLGNLSDLEVSIKYVKASIDALPAGHQSLPLRQQELAASLKNRYYRLGNDADLRAAHSLGKLAVDTMPPGHPYLAYLQYDLALTSLECFKAWDSLEDLEAGKFWQLRAIEATPAGHPELPSFYQNLGNAYSLRYTRLGELEDLELAIKNSKEAVGATPPDHPALPIYQQSLGKSYHHRFIRLGNLDDLYSAIKYNEAALLGTPTDQPEFPLRNQELGATYRDLYIRLGDIHHLEKAIEYNKLAVEKTPQGHPELAGRQLYLAAAYLRFFLHSNNKEHWNLSHKYYQEAVNNTPLGHPQLPARKQNLAHSYVVRSMAIHISNPKLAWQDILLALKYRAEAVESTPSNHPDFALYQLDLAASYDSCFQVKHEVEDLYCVFYLLEAVCRNISAFPGIVLIAASYWATVAFAADLPELCLKACSIAFSVLPDLLWLGIPMKARHDVLYEYGVSGMIASAVSAAIQYQKPELAVAFLEQGQAITQRQLLELQDDSSQLLNKYPSHAARLKQISFQLWHQKMQEDEETTFGLDFHVLANDRRKLIHEIRSLPDFQDFFLPHGYKKLSIAAQNGPVIMINCHDNKSHAIILVSPEKLQTIELPHVSNFEAKKQLGNLRKALSICHIEARGLEAGFEKSRAGRVFHRDTAEADFLFKKLIWWLQMAILEPVFSVLKEHGIDHGRIWWCPSGSLNYLPIHAAASLDSKYIQSYTPTLEALINGRKHHESLASERLVKVSAIGITRIKDFPALDLPLVGKEIEQIHIATKMQEFNQVLDSEATVSHVLEVIKSAQWLHLACHGQQHFTEPLKSSIILSDGHLELGQILESSLPAAEFVFLSACQTAMGNAKLMNEALHLAGGFIAAGFQAAIGTLWNMADSDGPLVSKIVYQRLFSEGKPDVTDSAEALHLAVQSLRKQGVPFQRWMPFIHMGI